MADTTYSEITISGKTYKLNGKAEGTYLQELGDYITGKYDAMKTKASYAHLTPEQQSLMLQLNMADDYYQAKKKEAAMAAQIELLEKQIYDLKHELVAVRIQMEKDAELKIQNLPRM